MMKQDLQVKWDSMSRDKKYDFWTLQNYPGGIGYPNGIYVSYLCLDCCNVLSLGCFQKVFEISRRSNILQPCCWLEPIIVTIQMLCYRSFSGYQLISQYNSECWLWHIKPSIGWIQDIWRTVCSLLSLPESTDPKGRQCCQSIHYSRQ